MTDTADPSDLQRFVAAQEGVYDAALAELRRGRKTSHWMWFVFPQVRGLGRSPTAQRYAVTGLEEARAYLGHPLLGPRLRECAAALLDVASDEQRAGRRPDAARVLGPVDATKLRSSMTLFALAAPEEALFAQVLDRFYGGEQDPLTLAQTSRPSSRS